MAIIDCTHEPVVIAVLKTVGPTLALVGAIAAWLANNLISWCSWQIGRSIRSYEAMKALKAEIASNKLEEVYYNDPTGTDKLIASLKADLGPYKPWIPYAPVIEGNPVFDNLVSTLVALPATVAERVVAYYNLSTGLTGQLKDFTSDAFKGLSHARQEAVIRALYPLGVQLASAADGALTTIELHLRRYRIAAWLVVAVGAIAIMGGLPSLIGASRGFARVFTSAAEWASTCDVAPEK
jgi:hypothetical protein